MAFLDETGLKYFWGKIKDLIAYYTLAIDPDNKLYLQKQTKYMRGEGVLLANMAYPVGSIYMSVNNTNPHDLFGGTWEQLKDRFLLGTGDSYKAGITGGEASHTLTVDEIPSHRHYTNSYAKGYPTATSGTERYTTLVTLIDTNNPNANPYPGTNKNGSIGTSTTMEGGGQAHNNMPPYLTVYMWKRTA